MSVDNLIESGLNAIAFIRLIVGVETEYDIEFDDDFLNLERYTSISEAVMWR